MTLPGLQQSPSIPQCGGHRRTGERRTLWPRPGERLPVSHQRLRWHLPLDTWVVGWGFSQSHTHHMKPTSNFNCIWSFPKHFRFQIEKQKCLFYHPFAMKITPNKKKSRPKPHVAAWVSKSLSCLMTTNKRKLCHYHAVCYAVSLSTNSV